jgi:PAS domain S-box-containing protein
MKILYVTHNLGNADFLEHEIRELIPTLRMDVSPHLKDAYEKVNLPGQYEAVLLDPDLAEDDGLSLIIHIRAHRLPLAVIRIIPANDKNPPIRALKAGADDYINKRVSSIRRLPDILQRVIDRYSRATSQGHRPVRVLYAGEIQPALRKLGHLHHIQLSAARIDDEGSWQDNNGERLDEFAYDAVVLEDTFSGSQVLQYLKDLNTRAPEIPVLILIPPDKDDNAAHAVKLGAAHCVFKTGDYYERLLQTLEETIRHRDLAREQKELLEKELRLRTLIETVPASIVVMACDGTVMAINKAGLQTLGIQNPDWMVGKKFTRLIDPEYRSEFSSFLERICGGSSDSIVCPCRTANDTDQLVEFRAVPFRREQDLVTILCTVHANHLDENQPPVDAGLQDLAQQLKSSEQKRSTLQDELKSAETARAELLEVHHKDKERLDVITSDLEQASTTIKELRFAAEERKSRHERQLEEERIQGDTKIRELGERLRASEEERLSLQEALKLAQEAQAEFSERAEHNQEQLNRVNGELDQSQAAVEELRLSAENQRSELLKQIEDEVTRGETACQEIRKQLEDSEKQRSELDESLKLAATAQVRFLEEKREDRENLETARTQLSESEKAFEKERLARSEQHDAERSEWENKLQELEPHLNATVENRNQLEESLRELEADREERRKEFTEDRSRWADQRQRLEQRCAEVEESCASAVTHARQVEEDYESQCADGAAKRAALEDQKVTLEEALRRAESAQQQMAEEHEKQLASQAAAYRKTEQELQKVIRRKDELAEKLRALQLDYVETMKEQQSELSTLKDKHLEQGEKLRLAEATVAKFQNALPKSVAETYGQRILDNEQAVQAEALSVSGKEAEMDGQISDSPAAAGSTGTQESQIADLKEEIRLLQGKIETLRKEIQQQLTARKNLSHALSAMAVRHRELIGFRRRDKTRLEALREELEELRSPEIHNVEFRIGRRVQPILVTVEMMTAALKKYYPQVESCASKVRLPVSHRNRWKAISEIIQRLQELSPEKIEQVQRHLNSIKA